MLLNSSVTMQLIIVASLQTHTQALCCLAMSLVSIKHKE